MRLTSLALAVLTAMRWVPHQGAPVNRRAACRAAALPLLTAAGLTCARPEAQAFCGETYPRWAYFLEWDEQLAQARVGDLDWRFYVRCLGNGKEERKASLNPVLVIPGGPGLSHDYLETIEGVASSPRRVIDFDPALTGRSLEFVKAADREALRAKGATTLATAEAQSAMASAAAAAFLSKQNRGCHVVAHGAYGCAAALRMLQQRDGPRVLSVALASPLARTDAALLDGVPRSSRDGGGSSPFPCVKSTAAPALGDEPMRADARAALAGEVKALPAAREAIAAVPVAILSGTGGGQAEADLEGMRRAIEDAGAASVALRLFPGADELAHLTRRDDFVQAVLDHVDAADAKLREG